MIYDIRKNRALYTHIKTLQMVFKYSVDIPKLLYGGTKPHHLMDLSLELYNAIKFDGESPLYLPKQLCTDIQIGADEDIYLSRTYREYALRRVRYMYERDLYIYGGAKEYAHWQKELRTMYALSRENPKYPRMMCHREMWLGTSDEPPPEYAEEFEAQSKTLRSKPAIRRREARRQALYARLGRPCPPPLDYSKPPVMPKLRREYHAEQGRKRFEKQQRKLERDLRRRGYKNT